jgi:hypothetical protein
MHTIKLLNSGIWQRKVELELKLDGEEGSVLECSTLFLNQLFAVKQIKACVHVLDIMSTHVLPP